MGAHAVAVAIRGLLGGPWTLRGIDFVCVCVCVCVSECVSHLHLASLADFHGIFEISNYSLVQYRC